MSRATRRLLLDYQPLWIVLGLFVFAILVFMDWGWLFSVRSTQMIQWFVPIFGGFLGIAFQPKQPAWQVLPVPAADRWRALWWIWIGLPIIRVAVAMLLPLMVLTPLKGVHATPAQIAGVLGIQLVAVIIMGALSSSGGALRRRFGLASGFFVVVPMFLVAGVASSFRAVTPAELAVVWSLALAMAVGTYAAIDRIGAAAVRFGDHRETAAAPDSAYTGWAARGWGALVPYVLGAVLVASAAAVAINYSLLMVIGRDMPEAARRNLPAQMILMIVVLSAVGGQAAPYALRSLRALPVGPAALTAILQGFMLTILLAPLAAVWAVLTIAGLDMSRMPVYLVATIPIVAVRLPVNFRVGIQIGAFVSILPIIPVMFLRFAPWAGSPGFVAACLMLTAALWSWTWWELACGRAAYRVLPVGLSRWRGGIN